MAEWIDLGEMEFTVVSGGRFRLDGGAMFGIIPRVLWERTDPPDAQNRIALDTRCVVVRSGGKISVIDTGNGGKLDAKERGIFALEEGVTLRTSLESIGIAPETVDRVILSHLHLDHAGGGTEWGESGDTRPTFPNAVYLVQRREWEDALQNRSTMRVSYRRENLEPLSAAGQLQLLEGDQVMAPGIEAQVTGGHTWGHQRILLRGSRATAVYAGDTLPTWSHLKPPYNMAYDQEPYANMMQKLKLLEEAAQHQWIVIPSHDPRVPFARVEEAAPGQWRRVA